MPDTITKHGQNYDPTLGRYIQVDPLGLVDGASVYGYALQNPGRYMDPRGERSLVPSFALPVNRPGGGGGGRALPLPGQIPNGLGAGRGGVRGNPVGPINPTMPSNPPRKGEDAKDEIETDSGQQCPDPCKEAKKRKKAAERAAHGASCGPRTSSAQAAISIGLFKEVIKARSEVSLRCFGGPDASHQGQIRQLKNALNKCKGYL